MTAALLAGAGLAIGAGAGLGIVGIPREIGLGVGDIKAARLDGGMDAELVKLLEVVMEVLDAVVDSLDVVELLEKVVEVVSADDVVDELEVVVEEDVDDMLVLELDVGRLDVELLELDVVFGAARFSTPCKRSSTMAAGGAGSENLGR